MAEYYHFEFADEGFPFCLLHAYNHGAYERHRHHFTELVVILEGQGLHILDEVAYPVRAGDVFVVTTESTHAYRDVQGLQLVNVLFRPSLLAGYEAELRALPGYHALFTVEPHYRQLYGHPHYLQLPQATQPGIYRLLKAMETEFSAAPAGYRTVLLTQLVQLLILLARCYSDTPPAASGQLLQVSRAISHMESHYADAVTLTDLTEVAQMSERNFFRRFVECTGHTPMDYLLRVRLRHGVRLLLETEQPIYAIASAVGVPDSNYFTRQFKRLMGVGPRELRKKGE